MNQEYLEDTKRRTIEIDHDTALVKQFVVMGGTCLRDGNMYGAVIGDLPTGCAGFEPTRIEAILKCMNNLYNEKAVIPGGKGESGDTTERSEP